MSAAEKPSRSEALEKILESLEGISDAHLLPADWDTFEQALAAILAAMDRDDVTAVSKGGEAIDVLDQRQQNVAGKRQDAPVKQPPTARSASDNLSRQIKEDLAAKERETRR